MQRKHDQNTVSHSWQIWQTLSWHDHSAQTLGIWLGKGGGDTHTRAQKRSKFIYQKKQVIYGAATTATVLRRSFSDAAAVTVTRNACDGGWWRAPLQNWRGWHKVGKRIKWATLHPKLSLWIFFSRLSVVCFAVPCSSSAVARVKQFFYIFYIFNGHWEQGGRAVGQTDKTSVVQHTFFTLIIQKINPTLSFLCRHKSHPIAALISHQVVSSPRHWCGTAPSLSRYRGICSSSSSSNTRTNIIQRV